MKLRHNFDTFDSHVLVLARTPAEWKRLRRKTVPSLRKKVPTGLGEAGHSIWTPNNGMDGGLHFFTAWIDVRHHSRPELLVNTCAHEASHLAAAIYESVKATGKSSIDEPYAYLVGFITQWLYERCVPMLPESDTKVG